MAGVVGRSWEISGDGSRARRDGRVSRLRYSTKVSRVFIREMRFADNAVLVTHTMEDLQQLMEIIPHSCKEFGLNISVCVTFRMYQLALHLRFRVT